MKIPKTKNVQLLSETRWFVIFNILVFRRGWTAVQLLAVVPCRKRVLDLNPSLGPFWMHFFPVHILVLSGYSIFLIQWKNITVRIMGLSLISLWYQWWVCVHSNYPVCFSCALLDWWPLDRWSFLQNSTAHVLYKLNWSEGYDVMQAHPPNFKHDKLSHIFSLCFMPDRHGQKYWD